MKQRGAHAAPAIHRAGAAVMPGKGAGVDELLEQLLAIVIDTIRREETRDDFALAGPSK